MELKRYRWMLALTYAALSGCSTTVDTLDGKLQKAEAIAKIKMEIQRNFNGSIKDVTLVPIDMPSARNGMSGTLSIVAHGSDKENPMVPGFNEERPKCGQPQNEDPADSDDTELCVVVKNKGVTVEKVDFNGQNVCNKDDFGGKEIVVTKKIRVSDKANEFEVAVKGSKGNMVYMAVHDCTKEPSKLLDEVVLENDDDSGSANDTPAIAN